jgi:hypothetical protein
VSKQSSAINPCPPQDLLQREIISRRELSRRFLGVAAAWSLSGLHPVWAQLPSPSPMLLSALTGPDWTPLFLAPDQHQALQSFAEAILSGSTKAYVSPFIDLLLSVGTPAQQDKFLTSLAAVRAEATRRFGSTFQMLSASQRDSLLTSISTSPKNTPNLEAFEYLKAWVVGSYYSSEMGMKELGWTPDRFFDNAPGCIQPGVHS